MKFGQTVLLAASVALLEGTEARYRSEWAQSRANRMKYRLERTFGPGLRDLHDENGKVRVERLGWANKIHQRLGQSLSINLGPITLDAGSTNAYWLGFVQGMNYSLKPGAEPEAGEKIDLSNCFASTYALLESFDIAAYNFNTFSAETGTYKIFDVLILDPIHVLADSSVTFEQCEFANIYSQFMGMASLDYAAFADNLGRQVSVLFTEMPEAFDVADQILAAGQCVVDEAEAAAEEAKQQLEDVEKKVEEEVDKAEKKKDETIDPQEEERGDEEFWSFQADVDSAKDEAKDEIAEAQEKVAEAEASAKNCIGVIDQWNMGKVFGRLFTSFFDNALKPV